MIVGSCFLIICPSNYVSLISLSPLNNQVLVYGEQHQIEAQFNFTLLQDSEGCSDYSACSQSPLNHYFSPRYLHGAPSLFLSRSLSACTTCFVFFFHFLLSVQSVLSGRQHLDARWTLIRVNENTVLLGERMARAALESLPLTRKWTEKKKKLQSPPRSGGGEEERRGGREGQRMGEM